jgi:hypothetical protein
MALDRTTSQRADPAWVAQRLGDRESRAVFASRDGVLVAEGDTPELLRCSFGDLAAAGLVITDPILLGLEAVRALFAADLDALPGLAPASLAAAAGGASRRREMASSRMSAGSTSRTREPPCASRALPSSCRDGCRSPGS